MKANKEILQGCIGNVLNEVVLEWFYLGKDPVKIISLYLRFNNWIRVLCSEEDVLVFEIKEHPQNHHSGEFEYVMINKDTTSIKQTKLIDVRFLIDTQNIKRGILFIFENEHNLCFINRGYEFGEIALCEMDVAKEKIIYNSCSFQLLV